MVSVLLLSQTDLYACNGNVEKIPGGNGERERSILFSHKTLPSVLLCAHDFQSLSVGFFLVAALLLATTTNSLSISILHSHTDFGQCCKS